MADPTQQHSRRVGDLIDLVQGIIDEVNEYLRTGEGGPGRKQMLMRQQAEAMAALNKAMDMQRDLLSTMVDTGEPLPTRRATDPQREKPRLRTVEDQFFADLRRRAGIEE